jgi:TolA-binding protein
LSQAAERGTGNCLRGCTASDLSALADAARYSGRTDLADQSLHALRNRFAQSSEGRSAAFLLGRLSEGRGAAAEARIWYERYLNETPGGPYAAEALAGKMRTTSTLDGPSAARAIAEQYLHRYPTGVQAGTARGILGSR